MLNSHKNILRETTGELINYLPISSHPVQVCFCVMQVATSAAAAVFAAASFDVEYLSCIAQQI